MSLECDRKFDSQTTYDRTQSKYTTNCGICGKAETRKKKWFQSCGKTLSLLRLEFNFCPSCNRWVCEDCFLVDDGQGAIGICTECARKQGIAGFTIKQAMSN